MLGIIIAIIVGGLAGWIASMIMKTDASMGALANIVVGIVGAFLGNLLLSPLFGVSVDLQRPSWLGFGLAILGSVILLAIIKLFTAGRNRI